MSAHTPLMQQPHPSTLPREWPEGKRDWKSGLCSCSADPDGGNRCCLTFWCPFIAFGKMSENEETPIGVPGKGTCLGGFCAGTSGPLSLAIAQNATRHDMKIEGNWFCDIWEAFCCFHCAHCRLSREVDLKKAEKHA